MTFDQLRQKAEDMNIDTDYMSKQDIICAIQRVEEKLCCYGTEWVDYCDGEPCEWRTDCLDLKRRWAKSPDRPLI